ncbi:DNA-binding MarR family transcriptional regulator [Nocardioides albertanoniae]|uniref:DNA-binding MarR family transcriptional regulator n=1 Tax=Nocardioides albertanoniae TaxID=1175486 RepID=A0A543A9K4_9ACTN|nr:MarR family transcriptional regulator [Nocardioides albertanoniae]TQL69229.1 DNA-binding MarR family transcriptional regulator [Nocardioides albertanoniae]
MSTTPASGHDLSLALEKVVRLVREVSTAGDVSPTAAAVLAGLARTGPQRVTELARVAGVSQPAMTQLVNRLTRQGMLARVADDADRRAVLVEVTDAGREVLAARRRQRAGVLDGALARVSAEDRAAIAAALPALDRLAEVVLES